jgi:hypothetical protein
MKILINKIPFIKISILFASLFFYQGVCSDDDDGGGSTGVQRITVQVFPNNQVESCDNKYPLVGNKDVYLTVSVLKLNNQTGAFELYRNKEYDFNNRWGAEDLSSLSFTIDAPANESFKVIAVANQDCSPCIDFCPGLDGFPQFFGETLLNIGSTYASVTLILQTARCESC